MIFLAQVDYPQLTALVTAIFTGAAAIIAVLVSLYKIAFQKESATTQEWKDLVQELKEYVAEQERKLEDQEKRIETLEASEAEKNSRINELVTKVGGLNNEVEMLKNRRNADKAQITRLRRIVTLAVGHIHVLTGELVKLDITPPPIPPQILEWEDEQEEGG